MFCFWDCMNTSSQGSKEEAVFHAPHKQGSNKLRPYHVNDIREMLIEAGFTEDTVGRKSE